MKLEVIVFIFVQIPNEQRKDTQGGAIDPTNYEFYKRPVTITYRIYDE